MVCPINIYSGTYHAGKGEREDARGILNETDTRMDRKTKTHIGIMSDLHIEHDADLVRRAQTQVAGGHSGGVAARWLTTHQFVRRNILTSGIVV